MTLLIERSIVRFQKLSIPPPWKGFFLRPPTLWKFQSSFIHLPKFLGLWETPPPRNFQSLLWGGIWIFPGTTHYAIGWQGEEDSKMLVCDKRDRPINNSWFVKDLFKGKWSLVESFSNKILSRLSHKVCRLLSSPVLLHKS